MRRKALTATALLIVLLAAPADAHAAFCSWKGDLHGGLWNNAGNWNGCGGLVPGPGDVAYMGATNEGRDVTLSGTAATVAVVYGGSELIIDGTTLTVTGNPVTGPDITSFENAKVIHGGAIDITGPATVQGGIKLGETAGMSTGSVTLSGNPIKLSGAITEAAAGLGAATITTSGAVTIEPFTVLNVQTRFQNRGLLHTDLATEIVPTAGSPASDGDFEASANGTFLVRPGTGSTFELAPGSSVTGPGRFSVTPLVSGGGRVLVDPGATFTPGILETGGVSRFELNADAQVGVAELRANSGDGGRFGTGELRVTGPGTSLLLAAHLGGGRTRFDGPVRMEVQSDSTYIFGGAQLRTRDAVDWRQGGVDLGSLGGTGTWDNDGQITISNGQSLVSVLSGPGTLKNTGTITKSGVGPFLGSANVDNDGGTITVLAGRFGSDVPTGTYGTLTQTTGVTDVRSGTTLDKHVVLDGGTLKGRGTVRSLVNNGGVVEPGSSPGTLTVASSFVQGAGGLLRAEIEGVAPGAFDVLAVGGSATLGGGLQIVSGAFTPGPNDRLRILTANPLSGTWASVTGPAGYGVSYQPDGFTLCALGAPDCVAAPTPTPTPTATPTPTVFATATPRPTATPTPVPTVVPSGPPRVTAADVIVLPSARRCASRRTFRIRLRTIAGVKLTEATVSVNGRRVKVVRGARLKAPTDLRGLARGRVTVKTTVKLADGRRLSQTRRYRTCGARAG